MNLNKTVFNFSLLSLAAFAFDKIYSFFGHGVTSPWLSNMFGFLLGLGVVVFLLLKVFYPGIVKVKGYRLFYNIYNSGVAVLINGMMLKGILEIAGATSVYVQWFLYTGSGLIATGIVIGCFIMFTKSKSSEVISDIH